MIDMHSHILPALDDGSKSMEESLEMLKIAQSEGITTMIATPHNMPGKGCPSEERVDRRIKALREAAAAEGIQVDIRKGTEYFYREDILEWLEDDTVIGMDGTRCVLIEFDPSVGRTYVKNAVREILSMDYTPVIAHVERYAALLKNKAEAVEELRTMGALIQVNTGSLTGMMGFRVKNEVKSLLQKNLIDLLGTDAHSSRHRSPRMDECARYIRKKCSEEYAERLLSAAALYEKKQ